MQKFSLNLTTRDAGRAGRKLRTDKDVYGVVYGHGVESSSVKGELQSVSRLLEQAGTSHIIQLKIDDAEPVDVLTKEIDRHPVSGVLRHFDLYVLKKGEKIDVEVPVVLIGESPALKVGLLLHQLIDSIEVRTTPANIPESFEVDVSKLIEIGDTIHVSDLTVDEDVEIDEDLLEQPIVKVDEPQVHEEPEEPEEDGEDAEAEVPSEHGGDDETEETGDDSTKNDA